MSIKLETLRTFCTVAQTGNLAEAANRLGRTQSAVSMTLKHFEEHLGRKLFQGERKAQLSALGEQVFEQALKQVREYDETIQGIESAARSRHGQIRIVSVPSVAAVVFPAVTDHMTNRFSGLKIELRDTHTAQILDALLTGRADIGIASGHHSLNGIEAIPLFCDQFGLVASADHPLAMSSQLPTLEDVVTPKFIRNALCDLIQSLAFLEAVEKSDVTIQNTLSLIAMVQTGEWVTILPQTVSRFLPTDTVFRPIADLSDQREVYLYIRTRTPYASITQDCAEFIRSRDWS
ncbi:putative hydrogen peroxide-inducible genes activator [Falsiruegeria litorea R37]|uniref:Putative hydrogen peroxide-inducible genes activator n=1 Tax=Falsiruegeria litorea R37 TaxID=1200284 RepID=A0A1Y5SJY9_9RHOB|nr:LysR family transcriptional regulator [Falsiruegeria litorea]SLN42546.1 putative hydrogen peroxide-inducible genes activator [Falsiruegeria litorea R37]